MTEKLISIDSAKTAGIQFADGVNTEIEAVVNGFATKATVDLSNVDDTSDVDKPVSVAQANADAEILASANAYTNAHAGGGSGVTNAVGFIKFGYAQSELAAKAFSGFDGTTIPEVLQGIKDAGATDVRTVVWWGDVQAVVGGSLDWTGVDRFMTAASALGLNIILTPTSPGPASGSPTIFDFGHFCGLIAARYGSAGTGQLSVMEVWNEPNHTNSAAPFAMGAATFAPLMANAYTSIKAADSHMTVLLGGLAADNTVTGVGEKPADFLADFYTIPGADAYFDGVAFHYYSHDITLTTWQEPTRTQDLYLQLIAVRQHMIDHGDSTKNVWITEMGLPAGQVTDPVQRADWLAEQVNLIRQLPWVETFCFYNYRNTAADQTNPANTYGSHNFTDLSPIQPTADMIASINSATKGLPGDQSVTFASLAPALVVTSGETIDTNTSDTLVPTTQAVVNYGNAHWGGGGGGSSILTHFEPSVGDGTDGNVVINHGLNTWAVRVTIRRNVGYTGTDVTGVEPGGELIAPNILEDSTGMGDPNHVTLNHTGQNWGTGEFNVMIEAMATPDMTAPSKPTITQSFVDVSSIEMTASGSSGTPTGMYWFINGTFAGISAWGDSFTFTGLALATTYAITGKAFDLMGNASTVSDTSNITTGGSADTTPPTAGTITESSKTATSITYTFTGGSDNIAVTHIDAYDGNTNALVQANVTSPWTRTGLSPSTATKTYLKYYDAAGNNTSSNTDTTTTNASAGAVNPICVSTGNRVTSGTSVGDSVIVPSNSNQLLAVAVVTMSHNQNNPDAESGYTSLGMVDDQGNTWTFVGGYTGGQFSGSQFGTVLFFESQSYTAAETHGLTVNVAKAALTFTSIQVKVRVYENATALKTPIVKAHNTTGVVSISDTIDANTYGIAGIVSSGSLAGGSFSSGFNVIYNAGGSVSGTGDFMGVLDQLGPGSPMAITSSGSQAWGAIMTEVLGV